jgi:hypothetical protein
VEAPNTGMEKRLVGKEEADPLARSRVRFAALVLASQKKSSVPSTACVAEKYTPCTFESPIKLAGEELPAPGLRSRR